MKKIFFTIAGVLLLYLTFVYAVPALPAFFYGDVALDGQPAPSGTKITAFIDNVERGSIITDEQGKYGQAEGNPKLLVTGEQSDNGKIIVFYVNNVKAEETAAWISGKISKVDLHASLTQEPPVNPPPNNPPSNPPSNENQQQNQAQQLDSSSNSGSGGNSQKDSYTLIDDEEDEKPFPQPSLDDDYSSYYAEEISLAKTSINIEAVKNPSLTDNKGINDSVNLSLWITLLLGILVLILIIVFIIFI